MFFDNEFNKKKSQKHFFFFNNLIKKKKVLNVFLTNLIKKKGFCFLSHPRHVARVTPPNFIGGNFVP
jgi:hypothetical protein